MIKKFSCLILLLLCISCSSINRGTNASSDEIILDNPENLYKIAKITFDQQNYELARKQFSEIKKLFPLSNEAIQSEIMIAFISYIQMDYDNAILNFKKIINRYPSHKDLDYVYYMIAISNYEQLQNESLDGYYNNLALANFDNVHFVGDALSARGITVSGAQGTYVAESILNNKLWQETYLQKQEN